MGTLRMPRTATLERPTSGTRRAVTREELDRAMAAHPYDRATPPPSLPVPSPLSPLSPFIAIPTALPAPEKAPAAVRRRLPLVLAVVVTVAVVLGAVVGFLLGRLSS